MTIASLRELTLAGDIDRKDPIMDALQGLGAIHLKPLVELPMEVGPDAADDFREALQYLLNAPRKRREQRPGGGDSLVQVVSDILANKYARADVIDRIEVVRQKQRSLHPWGDFELPRVMETDGYRFWFYRVPLRDRPLLEEVDCAWKIVHSDNRFHYLVVLSRMEPDVPFRRTHTGAQSLSQLEKEHEQALIQLEDLEAERESLTRWILPLTEARNQSLDNRDLRHAENQVLDAEGCFVLQGWIPESALGKLESLGDSLGVAWQLRTPTEADQPPTLLENGDGIGGGQEAVSFFQLPGYHAWDPSGLIFFSFSLFFAMILADAGYALLLGAILLLRWRRMSEPGSTAIRIRNLWASLVGCSVVYGALVGSWFGITPGEGGALSNLHLLDMNDFSGMMKLSLGAGAAHLVAANGMVAWTCRRSVQALASVGWMLGIAGAFLLWLDYMGDTAPGDSDWRYAVFVALGLILLFSGTHRPDSLKSAALQLFDGVKALYGLSRAFGDVLSYMRLFALGLSSASLAVTFNSLAVSARDSVDVGGGVLFVLILFLGHGMNFALALMSGVIHGLRLNLLEFYNWGIQGEGYPFKAFAKRGGSRWNNS